jgi:hypothetical protein
VAIKINAQEAGNDVKLKNNSLLQTGRLEENE